MWHLHFRFSIISIILLQTDYTRFVSLYKETEGDEDLLIRAGRTQADMDMLFSGSSLARVGNFLLYKCDQESQPVDQSVYRITAESADPSPLAQGQPF